MQVHVSHVYQEGKSEIDKLSNMAFSLQDTTWFTPFPIDCNDFKRCYGFGEL